MCCPLRKDKECAKLIVVIHVIPAHNTEDFSSSNSQVAKWLPII